MLEAMSGVPAYIRNSRLDILTGNALARALFAPIFTSPARPVNSARFTFLDPAATELALRPPRATSGAYRNSAGSHTTQGRPAATGSELRTAADVLSRAARGPWAGSPVPSPRAGLRTTAYLALRRRHRRLPV